MAKLPTHISRKPELVQAIHEALVRANAEQPKRGLRLSQIGECERRLWAEHTRGEKVDPPTAESLAIFAMGGKVEDLAVEWLELAEYEVYDRQEAVAMPVLECGDPSIGDDGNAFVLGHIDGVVNLGGVPTLLEVKSAKAKRWAECARLGYKEWSPAYWDQVQAYMGAGNLTQALAFVINKDDSSMHVEKIRFDPARYQELREKALRVLTSETAPPRIADSEHKAPCRWCPLVNACQGPTWDWRREP